MFFSRLLHRSSTRTFHYFPPPSLPPPRCTRFFVTTSHQWYPSSLTRAFTFPFPLSPSAFVCIQNSPACECHFLPKNRLLSRIRTYVLSSWTTPLFSFSCRATLVLSFHALSLLSPFFLFLSHSWTKGANDWSSLFVSLFSSSLFSLFPVSTFYSNTTLERPGSIRFEYSNRAALRLISFKLHGDFLRRGSATLQIAERERMREREETRWKFFTLSDIERWCISTSDVSARKLLEVYSPEIQLKEDYLPLWVRSRGIILFLLL